MRKVLLKYSEIALKGKNRNDFVNKLIGNIQKSANKYNLKILSSIKEQGRIFIIYETKDENKIISSLEKVFGIKKIAFIEEVEKDINSILQKSEELILEYKKNNVKSIGLKTKRVDKNFELTSPQINSEIGEIANKNEIKIDYKNSKEKIYIEITYKNCYIYNKVYKGSSGLPLDKNQKILCLLSGGIDSPVAALQLMKRGCHIDFFHIHTFNQNKFVLNSKIKDIVDKLNFYNFRSGLYLLSYNMYELKTTGKIEQRFELIYFKHYILKMAERIAKEYDYSAICLGDSLNQVASQTLKNIQCVSYDIKIPILRPLIGFDKEDIIKQAEKIGTFEISNIKYKDCCSINSKNPYTQANIDKFKQMLETIDTEELIEDSFKEVENFIIK